MHQHRLSSIHCWMVLAFVIGCLVPTRAVSAEEAGAGEVDARTLVTRMAVEYIRGHFTEDEALWLPPRQPEKQHYKRKII